jgi:Polyketide cyclase / dehydrase and lipid transport
MNDPCGFNPIEFTSAPHQTEGWINFRGSSDKVFARLADHEALGNWIPLVEKVTVTHPHPVAPGVSTIGTARTIIAKGGMSIVETVVYWNPPFCYAYNSEGKHLPLKNYIGLFQVEPFDNKSGRLIFREYFDGLNRVEQAIIPHGVVALFRQALGNLARLIGGTEYAMTEVSRP